MSESSRLEFSPGTLAVFVGHSDDAREEAQAIVGLQLELQKEIEIRLEVMPDGGRFTKIKIWEWRYDAKAVVGGQEKTITPFLKEAHVGIFIFKTRIGAETWRELRAFRDRVDDTYPVIVLFPANAPSAEQMLDVNTVSNWLDLLNKQKELTSDWTQTGSKSVVPVEAYRDKEHLLSIIREQFRRFLSGLLRNENVILERQEASLRGIRTEDELRIAYETTAKSRHPCNGASLNDLDWSLVELFKQQELDETFKQTGREQVLGELGLFSPITSSPMLHNAAVLCFCKRPHRFFPQAISNFIVGQPGDKSFILEDVTGPLSSQVEQLVSLTVKRLAKVSTFDDGGLRTEGTEIPLNVVREAISNAVAHRDYDIAGTIQVRLTESHLEIQNPGSFPADASWKVFLGAGTVSRPSDMAVALYLKRLLAVEAIGRGFAVFREHIKGFGDDSIVWEMPTPATVLMRIKRFVVQQKRIDFPTIPSQGLRVYLASVGSDLVAHRQVADDTILRLFQDAVVMERFSPLPGEPVAECERKAQESDVVVCIVAYRYGFVPEKGRGSITQREVEAAKAAGKDVLVWIVAEDHPWTEKKEQDLLTDPTVLADAGRVAEVAEGVASLITFKAWLRKSFVCEMFTTPDDLGRKIAIALLNYSPEKQRGISTPVHRQSDFRVVHALQPAPHFHGREALVTELTNWVADLASPDRVWSLVAAGGTGKSAVVERVVRDMKPGEANVLVWSFYEKPDADAFLRECNQVFLGEEEGTAGGRLERLERGLRDGRPHLIVLDGLERVQADSGDGRVRGELSDQPLRLLLRAVASGLGRARALVTSRFPLVDLQDWTRSGYRETRLDDLTPEAAVAVLRGWGVVGDEAALLTVASQVGYHALSVGVIGSYLHSFANGRIDEVVPFNLDAVTGDDPKAAKLARVLAFYAERLPPQERELLARLSVFPRGVTIELLGTLADAGGEVAGLLAEAKPRLLNLLASLKARGLVFDNRNDKTVTWTAHPFLRERFRHLLGFPTEMLFDVVARELRSELAERTKPRDGAILDRYEQLIEATRLAGREEEAIELYQNGIGGYAHLGAELGEYQRGYRMLVAFSATGRPDGLGLEISTAQRSMLANDLALYASHLGRLTEAWDIRHAEKSWMKSLGDRVQISIRLQNSSLLAFNLGYLPISRVLADSALTESEAGYEPISRGHSLAHRAITEHAIGDISAARADFASTTAMEVHAVQRLRDCWHVRHLLDLGELVAARTRCIQGIDESRAGLNGIDLTRFVVLLASINLAEGIDPTPYLDQVRGWTLRTGEMEQIIQVHLLTARHLLASGDVQGARGEAETGLLHAVACGYGLLRIELLVAMARIRLAWPDAPKAIQAAREALDLATHPDCQYAWGEADAAQVWGEAYFANHEPTLAKRAFTQTLAVRKRIEHPGVAETEKWLARTG